MKTKRNLCQSLLFLVAMVKQFFSKFGRGSMSTSIRFTLILLLMAGSQAMADDSEDDGFDLEPETMSLEQAATKANNPVSDAWILITQNDFTLLDTPDGTRWQNATTLQPILPIPIFGGEWNLVNRVITGVVSSPIDSRFDSPKFYERRTTGNTDTIVFSLAAPNRDDGFIWGVGPTFQLPTASRKVLGSQKWSAGPAALVVRLGDSFGKPSSIESWNMGVLAQHWWDFAGSDRREDFNQSNIQYFINYKYNPTQLIGMTPNILINWEERGDDKFSVPIGLGTIGFMRLGNWPVRWGVEVQYYVMTPDHYGPEWNLKIFFAPIAPNPFK